MYHIISMNGEVLGKVDEPRYIKRGEYGSFVETDEVNANGISFNGNVYNLKGHGKIGGIDTVLVKKISIAQTLEKQDRSLTSQTQVSTIMFVIMAEAGNIDETTAAEHLEVFAEWTFPVNYTIGNIRRYNGELYRCLQAHTSQENWTPDVSVSLWKKIGDPTVEWPEWSQPIGASDQPYMKGDKVTHNGKKWISDIDNNVWEPGAYGWTEYNEEESVVEV